MTHYVSFLLIKNESYNLKHLLLVTFLLLLYLYILIYHSWNLPSFEIPEILIETLFKRNLLNIERKITRYIHHKEFFQNYKEIRKYSEDLALKFNQYKYKMEYLVHSIWLSRLCFVLVHYLCPWLYISYDTLWIPFTY